MLRITFSRDARNSLRRMGRRDAERILDALEKLAAEPEGAKREQAGTPTRPPLDVRPLRGREAYRLRVGNWRVIFDRSAGRISVKLVASRGGVYKR